MNNQEIIKRLEEIRRQHAETHDCEASITNLILEIEASEEKKIPDDFQPDPPSDIMKR